jgi:hypothetical protein
MAELPGGELFAIVSTSGNADKVLYRSTSDFSTWDPAAVKNPFALQVSGGLLYVAQPSGVARSDAAGASFTVVPGTEAIANPTFTFNSAGTMLASSPGQALYACDGSICTAMGDRTLAAAGLQIFSDDRLLSGAYLSTAPTTDW